MSKLYKFLLALISITTLNCTSKASMSLGVTDHGWDGDEKELDNYVKTNHQIQDPGMNPDYEQKEKIEADPMNWVRQRLDRDGLDRMNSMIRALKRVQEEQEVLIKNVVDNNNDNNFQKYNIEEKLYGNEKFIKNLYDLYIMALQALPSGYFEQETAPFSHCTRFYSLAVGPSELSRQRNKELVLIGLGRGINPNIYANHQDRNNVVTTSIKQVRLGALEALVDYTLENPDAENIPDWSYINHDIGLVADIYAGQPRIHRECARQLVRLRYGSPVIWNGLSPELRQIILRSL